MKPETGELLFGLTSTCLYIGWAYFAVQTDTPSRGVMLVFYACANLAILWPSIRRFL